MENEVNLDELQEQLTRQLFLKVCEDELKAWRTFLKGYAI